MFTLLSFLSVLLTSSHLTTPQSLFSPLIKTSPSVPKKTSNSKPAKQIIFIDSRRFDHILLSSLLLRTAPCLSRPHITHHHLVCHRHLNTKSRNSSKTRKDKAQKKLQSQNFPAQSNLNPRPASTVPCHKLQIRSPAISSPQSHLESAPERSMA